MITKNDTIVIAYPEYVSGPGYSNALVCVIVRGNDGTLREEYLQLDEQDADIRTLFMVCAAASASITKAVKKLVESDRPKKQEKVKA